MAMHASFALRQAAATLCTKAPQTQALCARALHLAAIVRSCPDMAPPGVDFGRRAMTYALLFPFQGLGVACRRLGLVNVPTLGYLAQQLFGNQGSLDAGHLANAG